MRQFAGAGVGKNVSRDYRNQVLRDVATAKYLIKKGNKFWTEMNCDFRGRVYALPHFNFAREDHVRALFLFANGEPIGSHVGWLEIAVANAFGEKEEWKTRRHWVEEKRELIKRVAEDPMGSVEEWRGAKDPFSSVAACMELTAAWRDPNFTTRFPVLLDGTCNGVQHLALMTKDEEAGWLVNVAGGDELYDLYDAVRGGLKESLAAAADYADWERLEAREPSKAAGWLERGIKRDVVKRPIMTLSYGVTKRGMTEQIMEACEGTNVSPTWDEAWYLANKIWEVAAKLLPRPMGAMEFMRGLAGNCADKNLPLRWVTLTGLPVGNRCYKPKTNRVQMMLRGETVTPKIADGYEPKIQKMEAQNAAPASIARTPRT